MNASLLLALVATCAAQAEHDGEEDEAVEDAQDDAQREDPRWYKTCQNQISH